MVYTVLSGAVHAVGGYLVRVEVDMADGLPCIELVGVPAKEVREAVERVRVALKNSGYPLPPKRFTINLSPAGVRKGGTAFDLPIAVGMLGCMGLLADCTDKKTLLLGEMGLDGSVRGVKGVLPVLLAAKEAGVERCILPTDNQREGSCIEGLEIVAVDGLCEAIRCLSGGRAKPAKAAGERRRAAKSREPSPVYTDFADIRGQALAKRAAQIAAAGMHNLLLVGPPGTGKSLIASAIAGILPGMEEQEMLETSRIYSVAGLLNEERCFIRERPFLHPHHTVTPKALIGGGIIPTPGIISLSNHGVLFLDELPEFKRETLDMLRQPLEEGRIVITRKSGSYVYPCRFMLVAAMNPCPCGYYPDPGRCRCSEREVKRYAGKVSGPLLDRIDLCVGVEQNSYEEARSGKAKERSADIRRSVEAARRIQRRRNGEGVYNSRIPAPRLQALCQMDEGAETLLRQYYERNRLGMRSYHKILRVARTVADLSGEEKIGKEHLLEALAYRKGQEE